MRYSSGNNWSSWHEGNREMIKKPCQRRDEWDECWLPPGLFGFGMDKRLEEQPVQEECTL